MNTYTNTGLRCRFAFFCLTVASFAYFSSGTSKAGDSYLKQAISAYENFEYHQALTLLLKASNYSGPAKKKYMAKVHLYTGLVRFTLGQREQAAGEFKKALELDYSVYPPDDTSPKIVSVFIKVKNTLSPPEEIDKSNDSSIKDNKHTDIDLGTTRPKPVKKSGGRLWTWVLTGIGSAVLVGGGVFAGLAAKSKGEFDDAQWASDAVEKRDEVEQRSLTANVLFGVGGAAMVGALILFFVEDGEGESYQEQSAVRLDVGFSGISARIRF